MITYIRRVADELAEEDLVVTVQGVDDQAQQPIDLRLEQECLRIHWKFCSICAISSFFVVYFLIYSIAKLLDNFPICFPPL